MSFGATNNPSNPSLYQLKSEKGGAGGYASLDGGGKVPVGQLPAGLGGGAGALDELTDVALAGLAENDMLMRKSGVFVNRAPAQVKADLGLNLVNNTPDSGKPVSTAQAAADTSVLNTAKSYADALVVGAINDRGNFDASVNSFPAAGGSGTSGAIKKGNLWIISVAGTLGGAAVSVGDQVRALTDAPGQTAANWAISEANIGYVPANDAAVVKLSGAQTINDVKTFSSAPVIPHENYSAAYANKNEPVGKKAFYNVIENLPSGGGSGGAGTLAVTRADGSIAEVEIVAGALPVTLANGSIVNVDLGLALPKESQIIAATTADYFRGDKTFQSLPAAVFAMVLTGLSLATNAAITSGDTFLSALGKLQKQITDLIATVSSNATAAQNPGNITQSANYRFVTDTEKATWNAKQAALGFTPENSANKNQNSGYAGLDSSGKIASSQLPSYVDDVLEYANLGAFPATGDTGKLYVRTDNNSIYRWSGSTYIEVSASSGSVGSTDSIAEGSVNLYYTAARFDTRLAAKTTDNLTQGATNKYNQTHTGDVTGATALTIAANAVTTTKIADANITTAKIADANVTTGKIADANVTAAKIADGAITPKKVAAALQYNLTASGENTNAKTITPQSSEVVYASIDRDTTFNATLAAENANFQKLTFVVKNDSGTPRTATLSAASFHPTKRADNTDEPLTFTVPNYNIVYVALIFNAYIPKWHVLHVKQGGTW